MPRALPARHMSGSTYSASSTRILVESLWAKDMDAQRIAKRIGCTVGYVKEVIGRIEAAARAAQTGPQCDLKHLRLIQQADRRGFPVIASPVTVALQARLPHPPCRP